jgi:hypothetical protein
MIKGHRRGSILSRLFKGILMSTLELPLLSVQAIEIVSGEIPIIMNTTMNTF